MGQQPVNCTRGPALHLPLLPIHTLPGPEGLGRAGSQGPHSGHHRIFLVDCFLNVGAEHALFFKSKGEDHRRSYIFSTVIYLNELFPFKS